MPLHHHYQTMIRFLIWILLLYLALRFIFKLFGGMQPKQANYQRNSEKETYTNKSNQNKQSNNKDQLGEYVDYEEVK